jgi:biofilm protein TabA
MIIDSLANAHSYFGLGPRIERALRYLREVDFARLETGKHAIEGEEVFALAQRYESKAPGDHLYEAHRRYIDVQYVAEGIEAIGYAPIESLRTAREYDPGKDAEMFSGSGVMLRCPRGCFAIFFPQDGHLPCMAIDAPAPVGKIVVKVRA